MLSELHLASSLFAHHKGKHVLNFTELRRDMNSKTVKTKVHTGLNAARWNEKAVERCWEGPGNLHSAWEGAPGNLRKCPCSLWSGQSSLTQLYKELCSSILVTGPPKGPAASVPVYSYFLIFWGCHLQDRLREALRVLTYMMNITAVLCLSTKTPTNTHMAVSAVLHSCHLADGTLRIPPLSNLF